MLDGTIKHYDGGIGSGMILPEDGSTDVFFNRHVVQGGDGWVADGVAVRYELFAGGGSPQASHVEKE